MWKVHDARGEFAEGARSMMAAYRLDETDVKLNIEIGDYLVRYGRHDLAPPFVERAWNWSHQISVLESASELLGDIQQTNQ